MGAGGMTAEFSDHVVLVTGAASGIGLATAAAFAAEGALLALADVNAKKLEAETARLAPATTARSGAIQRTWHRRKLRSISWRRCSRTSAASTWW